jgi:hypothetical protein
MKKLKRSLLLLVIATTGICRAQQPVKLLLALSKADHTLQLSTLKRLMLRHILMLVECQMVLHGQLKITDVKTTAIEVTEYNRKSQITIVFIA